MKDYFDKFKGLKPNDEVSLDDKLVRGKVRVLWVSPHDHILNIGSALKVIGMSTDIFEVDNRSFHVYNPEDLKKDYHIVVGANDHSLVDLGVSKARQKDIGGYRGNGEFLIYADCCHQRSEADLVADMTLSVENYMTCLAYVIKDKYEKVDGYLDLKNDFAGIVELAFKNNDLDRAKCFTHIARYEFDDCQIRTRFVDHEGKKDKLMQVLTDAGRKDFVIDIYNKIKKDYDYKKEHNFHLNGYNARTHINLFNKYNGQLGISKQEFDINLVEELIKE